MIDVADTPFAAVDLGIVDRNITRMQAHCDALGVRFRPHVKTHKIPQIARLQIAAGAVGITCQKLGEAEAMVDGGVEDVLISFPLVGAAKLERLVALARRARISVVADDERLVVPMAHALARDGLEIPVLVECETGLRRVGIADPEDAVRLARTIDRCDGVYFGGLLTYPTPSDLDRLAVFVEAVEKAGIAVGVVSAGGTVQTLTMRQRGIVDELRAGTYIYGDRGHVAAGVMRWEDCALRIMATVISARSPDRVIVDAGSKTLTMDPVESTPPLPGFGYVLEEPAAVIYALSEEHGHIDASACERRFAVGDVVSIIPNHACGVSNLHDTVVAVRAGSPEAMMTVAARGTVR